MDQLHQVTTQLPPVLQHLDQLATNGEERLRSLSDQLAKLSDSTAKAADQAAALIARTGAG